MVREEGLESGRFVKPRVTMELFPCLVVESGITHCDVTL